MEPHAHDGAPLGGGGLRGALFALAGLLVAVPVSLADSATDGTSRIQPGAVVYSSVGQCTLNFAWRDAEGVPFLGTAGHCVSGVGARVEDDLGNTWGTVVFDAGSPDFALIRVDALFRPLVQFDVRHWGGPTGVSDPATTSAGDPVAIYGYGMLVSATEQTRARQGLLVSDGSSSYSADVPAVFGDSGGPVLHRLTGRALGVVSQLGAGSTLTGPTLVRIERALDEAGFDLTMATAPASGAIV